VDGVKVSLATVAVCVSIVLKMRVMFGDYCSSCVPLGVGVPTEGCQPTARTCATLGFTANKDRRFQTRKHVVAPRFTAQPGLAAR
jgi:hypothetical protein